jgi:pyruvate-formate lyase-activating enzyme
MLEEILNNRTLVHSIYYSNDEEIARIARFIASRSQLAEPRRVAPGRRALPRGIEPLFQP